MSNYSPKPKHFVLVFVVATLAVLAVLAVFLLGGVNSAFALLSTLPCPPVAPFGCFGGPILARLSPIITFPPTPMECFGIQIVVGPPRAGRVAIIPGITRVYDYHSLRTGSIVIGTVIPPIPFICGVADIALKIGTSK